LEHSLERAKADNAFAALLLYVPTVGELIHAVSDADPSLIHAIRLNLRRAMAVRLEKRLAEAVSTRDAGAFDPSAHAAGRRALKGAALSLLSTLGAAHEARIETAFSEASTMTTRLAALTALSSIETDTFDRALTAFEARWKDSPLVMDKWFGVQAMSVRGDIRDRLTNLAARPDYDLKNPNRVRALIAAFSMSNPVAFHASDGWGYRFLAGVIVQVDSLNPALSARLCTAFESWRAFDEPRRREAEAQLKRLSEAGLSKNAQDIVGRALGQPA
jgi:aminopeptidase N